MTEELRIPKRIVKKLLEEEKLLKEREKVNEIKKSNERNLILDENKAVGDYIERNYPFGSFGLPVIVFILGIVLILYYAGVEDIIGFVLSMIFTFFGIFIPLCYYDNKARKEILKKYGVIKK